MMKKENVAYSILAILAMIAGVIVLLVCSKSIELYRYHYNKFWRIYVEETIRTMVKPESLIKPTYRCITFADGNTICEKKGKK